ncbi:MAG: NAD(P)/FAD-dependent oxidoreductase, partial [Spirochaetia bacterium]|nr:NAD(P)/FAD-dependent oxidoreductase [Spirochaetia bacterium]
MIEQDIVIIGSGVAGMSAAQYAARAGRSVTVIEELAPGGQL